MVSRLLNGNEKDGLDLYIFNYNLNSSFVRMVKWPKSFFRVLKIFLVKPLQTPI